MTVREVEIEYEVQDGQSGHEREEGIVVPFDRLNPETLANLISEFVTRQWAGSDDGQCTLEEKVAQVRQQLQAGKAVVVFDFTTGTGNIVATGPDKP